MQKTKLFAGSFLTALFLFPAFCEAQTVLIISGNGQLVCSNCAGGPSLNFFAPLVVQVNDATGKAVGAGTTVTWTATQQGQTPVTATSTTTSSGQASYTFSGIAPFFNTLPATVVASALGASVSFVETSVAPGAGGGPAASATLETTNGLLPNISGPVGTNAPAIKVGVFGLYGAIPGVQISLLSGTTGPTVSCMTQAGQQAGTVLTDPTGTATCTPVISGKIGTNGSYSLYIGGKFEHFGPATVAATIGPAALITLVSGDKQTVNPGIVSAKPLVALVTDLGGNPVAGAKVTWSVVPAGNATLSAPTLSSLTNGQVSASVIPVASPVQVVVALASNSSIEYTFTVNVNTVVTSLQYVSGDLQSAKQDTAFADPLVVQVNDNTIPVPGVTVNFVVTSGSAAINPPSSVQTNAQGQAQVMVTAGDTPGQAVITANLVFGGKTYNYPFHLTVNPSGPTISSVVNSAGFDKSPLAASPCSIVTVYGTGLATGLQGLVPAFVAPQFQVAGVSVQFGNASAPILYVANIDGQESLSAQVPCEATIGSAVPLVVTADGSPSAPFDVNITPYSPGIFQFQDYDGQTRAVLLRPDGSVVTVGNAANPAVPANPARPGEIIRMFVTGLGQTTPPLLTDEFDPLVTDSSGNLVAQDLVVNAGLAVGVDYNPVHIVAARYAYGMVGVYEVDFELPTSVATGNDIPLGIVVFPTPTTAVFSNATSIPIQ
ncbi:MAG TPA: hypothetical protein VMG35_21650 [Bryobacteraceae bacterium]|nr:hypothetical protein [Bryobacteraceae bacterium]